MPPSHDASSTPTGIGGRFTVAGRTAARRSHHHPSLAPWDGPRTARGRLGAAVHGVMDDGGDAPMARQKKITSSWWRRGVWRRTNGSARGFWVARVGGRYHR